MFKYVVYVLMGLFVVGWAGCAITIPLAGYKYMSVVFEDNTEDEMDVHASAADD